MASAEARIPTDRAARYLTQLCQHLKQMDGHAHHGDATDIGRPGTPRRVDWTDNHGVIQFASGTCTLDATAGELVIKLDAADSNELGRMQQMFAARLATIGRRDNLVVTW